MKPCILFSCFIFLLATGAQAQYTAPVRSTLSTDVYHRHSAMPRNMWRNKHVRGGIIDMILGGTAVASGGTLFVFTYNSSHGTNAEGLGIAALGAFFMAIGGIDYAVGRDHVRRHPDRYTLIGKNNEIGLAYNF